MGKGAGRQRRGFALKRLIGSVAVLALACGGLVAAAPAAHAANFTVNDAGDGDTGGCDGESCTLREAVEAAETNSEPDNIEIASGINPALTQALSITITTQVTITGQGAATTTIDGGDNQRIFVITEDGNLTIEDVALTGGLAPDGTFGGGVGGGGGGVFNSGTLHITSSTLSGNSAGNGG
ncbi:MAG: CSLREA domain-containing protein, partial [Actinomycetota bacterium]